MIQRTLNFDTSAKLSRKSDPITSQKSAAETERQLGKLQSRCMDIVKRYGGRQLTANEIAMQAGIMFGGMRESYRKRIKELINRGLIEECGERRCEVTGKACRTFKVKEYGT